MSPSLHLFAAALAGFAAGALGAMGLGGGGVLLLYLALTGTGQLAAQGVNLTFFLPIAALSLVLHRKNGLVELSAAGRDRPGREAPGGAPLPDLRGAGGPDSPAGGAVRPPALPPGRLLPPAEISPWPSPPA